MDLKVFFLTMAVWWVQSTASERRAPEEDGLPRLMSATKVDLARTFLRPRLHRKDVAKMSVNQVKDLNISSTKSEHLASLFRRSNENFILHGSQVLQLRRQNGDGSMPDSYILDVVSRHDIEEGALFFEKNDWKNLFFLVVCYLGAYCRVLTSHTVTGVTLRQRIATRTTPSDVHFFDDSDELFLIIATDPCRIFRWSGAYFDLYDELPTHGARAVTAFRDANDAVVIVVAQNSPDGKVYSKVFVRRNGSLELTQLLETSGASDVASYSVTTADETLRFVFVLNSRDSSSVFWWNGREFSLWRTLGDIIGPGRICVGAVASDIFLFFAHQNKLSVYHPTEMAFDLVHALVLDRDILSFDLREEENSPPMLLLLTGSNAEPFLQVNLLSIDVTHLPVSESQVAITDPVLQCLADLKMSLEERGAKLDESILLTGEIDKKKEAIELDSLTVPEVKLKNFRVNQLKVNPVNEELEATPTEIRKTLEELREESKSLLKKVKSTSKEVRYRIHGDMLIDHLKASHIRVRTFNDRKFDLSNVLSATKNQTLSGAIRLATLSADVLTVPSINGIYVKDILLRNKAVQEITGEHTILSMKARNVVLGKLGRLNGTLFTNPKTKADGHIQGTIHGKKVFPRMSVKQLQVDYINSMPAEDWFSSILPYSQAFVREEALDFKQLQVTNLTVSNINGLPWKEFVEASACGGGRGTFARAYNTTARRLRARKINGIATEALLTKDVPQNVSSIIEVSAASAAYAKPRNFSKESPATEWTLFGSDGDGKSKSLQQLNISKIIFKRPVNISGRIVDLDGLHQLYWMKSRPQAVTADVAFPKELAANLLDVGRINNRSVDAFVKADEPSRVAGPVVLEDAHISGSVLLSPGVHQSVNLRHLYRSAVKTAGENRVAGRKTFAGNVRAKNLLADVINGVNLSGVPSGFEVPDLRGARVREAEIVGNVTVRGGVTLKYLNGHDLSDVVTRALSLDEPDLLERGNYSSLTVTELDADEINGVAGRLQRQERGRSRRLVVRGDLEVPEIKATTVNGIFLDEYLRKVVLKNVSDQIVVRGRKLFRGTVKIRGNLNGVLNDCNLTALQEVALSKTKPQNVTGAFTVHEFSANNVEGEVFCGIPTSHLLFQDKPAMQTVNSDVVFAAFDFAGNVRASSFMDGCDLSKVIDVTLNDIKKFGNLDVKGNLTWTEDREDYKGISYLYKNAVTRHEDQTVAGSVTFESSATFEQLSAEHHLNDVDLGFIAKDAIYRSLPVQDISQDITVKGTVNSDNVLVANNAIVDAINGLDILELDQKLIRNSQHTEVRGKKEFVPGFVAFRLTAGAVNGVNTDGIVFCDAATQKGSVRFPATTFQSVKATRDATVARVHNVSLHKFLEERLSRSREQTLSGSITAAGVLQVEGDAEIYEINDVNVNDTIMVAEENSPRLITGKVEFTDSLSIPGRLRVETVDGHDISGMYERALLNEGDHVIKGSVIFARDIESHGNIEVLHDVNGCDVKKFKSLEVPQNIGRIDMACSREIKSEIDKMANMSSILMKPITLTNLDARATCDIPGTAAVHKIAVNTYNETTAFDVYGQSSNNEECGLPGGCFCPTQARMILSHANLTTSSEKIFPRHYNYYNEALRVEVAVTTTTVSYTSGCERHNTSTWKEYTSLSWRKGNRTSETRGRHEPKTTFDQVNFAGSLNGAEFFRIGESIYVIMAFYFHPVENKMSKLNIVVYELNTVTEAVEKIQEIPMSGVQALNLFWTPRGVVLITGNGYDSESFADSVDSSIYRFNDSENKFQLLRSVNTHGILSIASVRHKKDSFIFLVQKQSWPFLILKYNQEYDNYYFSQKLDTVQSRVKCNFLSAAAFTTERPGYMGDVFLGVVQSDETFRLFRYKHIEGFVEELSQQQKNVKLLMPFGIGSRQYLFAVSSESSSTIYELVQQGYVD